MKEVLPALPPGWAYATISELIGEGVFADGDWVESKDQDPNGDVRLIQLADIGEAQFIDKSSRYLTLEKSEELRCTLLEKDDVLIARMPDPLGRACLFPEIRRPCVTVVDVCIIRGKKEYFDQRWLMHFTNAPHIRSEILKLQSGTTRKRISRKNLSTIVYPVPPRDEQNRIVEKLEELLSDLDNGVAELKAAQTKLTQYRQSLLKSAVEGSLTEEWRTKNTVSETGEQLLQRILKERRERWEAEKLAEFEAKGKKPPKDWQNKYPEPVQPDTSELPELPEGWVWASLGQCFKVEVGATPSRKEPSYWNGDIPWASSGVVQFGRVLDTKEKITLEGLNNSSTQINPKGSVLLGMIGEGKTRGQAAILEIPAANNQNCAAIWVSETQITPEYVFYWLWSRYEATRKGSSGNNQPALNKSLVEKIPIAISSVKEMTYIGGVLDDEFESAAKKEEDFSKALQLLNGQRKNILKEAFSGRLVPQNPQDEPAGILLEKIKAARAEKSQQTKPRRVKKKVNTMKKFDASSVRDWISNQVDSFTFEQMLDATKADYDALQDVVFELLESGDVLRQEFDTSNERIRFSRINK